MKPSIDQQIEDVECALGISLSDGAEEIEEGVEAAIETLKWVKRHTPDQTDPQLVTETNYRDVVAVALVFAGREATNDSIVVGVMRALKGMGNPASLKAEIERQRGLIG